MNIKPLADRVLILPAPAEEKTIGGIIIVPFRHLGLHLLPPLYRTKLSVQHDLRRIYAQHSR